MMFYVLHKDFFYMLVFYTNNVSCENKVVVFFNQKYFRFIVFGVKIFKIWYMIY